MSRGQRSLGPGSRACVWLLALFACCFWAAPTLAAIPSVPSGVAATPGNAQVVLTWTASTGAPTQYYVLRGTTTGGAYSQIATVTAPTVTYTDSTAANNTKYFYVIESHNGSGTSANSSEVSAVPGGANGLLGWWKLDDDTGTSVADSSGFSNTGTFASAGWTTGRIGYAGSFNGSSSAVDTGNDVIATTNSFTVACWVKMNSLTYNQTFVSQSGTNISNFFFQYNAGPGKFVLQTETADNITNGGPSVTSTTVPVAGTWYHVIGVYDAPNSQIKLYVNGSLQATTSYTPGWSASGHTIIGRGLYNGNPCDWVDGQIDDARVYNRLLTAAEIATISAYPTSVTAAQVSATSATISWTAFASATSYNLYRSTTAGGEGGTAIQTGLTGTSYTNTGLTPGSTYYYKLSATTASGESAQSDEASVTAITAPTGVAGTTSAATPAIISWSAVTGATSYIVYRGTSSGGETSLATGIAGTSYNDTTAIRGTTYYYKVAAVNGGWTSSQSSEVIVDPINTSSPYFQINAAGPAASPFAADAYYSVPAGFAGANASAVDVTAPNSAPQAVYQTERNSVGSTHAGGAVTYTLPGLTANGTYVVRLHFSDSYWSSAGSRTFNVSINGTSVLTNFDVWAAANSNHKSVIRNFNVTADASGNIAIVFSNGSADQLEINGIEVLSGSVTAAPSLTATEASATSATLTWSAVTGATSYNLYRSTSAGTEGSTPYQTGLTGTSYTNTGLTTNTTYYYKLVAVNAQGESALSSEVSITPIAIPTGLAVAQASATSSTVTWTAVTGATSYNLYRSTTAGGEGSTPIQTGLTGTSYTNTGLTSGTTYYYKLTAVNATAESPQSTEVSLAPLAAPTGVVATPGSAQVVLTWTATTGATTYNVLRGTTPGSENSLATGVATASYTDSTAANNTTYYYVVQAVNSGATSASSSEVAAVPGGVSGLLGWWKLDDDTGTSVADSSGFSNTGTFASAGWATGRNGYAGSFNGTSSMVDAGKGVIATANSFSVACWVKMNSGAWEDFLSQDGVNVSQFFLQRRSDTGKFEWDFFNSDSTGGGTTTADSTTTPVSGTWYHLIGMYDAPNSQIKLYVNGTLEATTAFTTPWSATGHTFIGRGLLNGSAIEWASGLIDDVRFYNRVLTTAEIATISAYPLSVTATQASATSATIAWTAFPSATSYNLYRSTTAGSEGGTAIVTGLTGTSYTNTALTSGTTYYYKLSATTASGESAQSNEISLTPVAAPTGLAVAQASATSSTVTWTAVTGATSYNLYRSTTAGGEGSTPVQTGLTGTSYTNTGLSSGTTYYYKLTAVTATSESSQSSEVSLTPVAAPTGLAVAQASATSSTVTWTAVTGATSYNLYRSTTSGGEGSTPVQTGLTGTSYTNTALTSGTTYYYTLAAVTATSTSAQSSEVSLTPVAAPTGLAVTEASATSSTLTWTAVTGATSYNLYRSTTAGGEGSTPVQTGLTGTSYTNTGLTTNTTYYYKLTAVTATSESAQSSEVSLTPIAIPTGLAVTQASATSSTLTWTAVTGATTYNLYRSTTAGGEGSTPLQTGLTGTSYTNTALTSGTTYYYKLTAVNATAESPQSTEVSLTLVAAPTGLAVTQASATSSTVTWTAVTGATSYNLYRSTTSGGEGATPVQTGLTGTSYTNTGLSTNTTYYYKLTAVTATSESAQSSEATYVPLAVPTSLAATQASATSATLTWAAVTGATSYNLYRSTTSGGEGSTPVQTGLASASYTDTGLTSGTTYYYTVAAVNATTTSAQSSEVSLTPVAAPTSLAVTQASATSVTLTWTAVTGATSYSLYRSTTAGGEGATPIQTGLTGTSYTNTGLTSGTTYYYKLTAVTATSQSAQSSEVSLAPLAAPTAVVATPGDAQVALTWTAKTGATSYSVLRGTAPGSETSLATGVATNSYTDSTAANNTTYFYVVQSVNSTTASANSSEVAATPGGSSGLLGWWKLDENTGTTANDSSGFSNTGTLSSTGWVTGRNGYADNFNGSVVDAGKGVIATANSFSVACWVKLNSISASNQTLISQTGVTVSGFFLISAGSSGKFGLLRETSDFTGVSYSALSTTIPVVGTWYHVLGIYDAVNAQLKLYVNGTLEGTQAFTTPWSATGDTLIGRGKYGGSAWSANAQIDDARVYNRLLTAAEIATISAYPTSVTATQASATSATIAWTAFPSAISYNLYRSTSAGTEGGTPIQTGLTGTSYTNTGLTSGTTYYYKLSATTASGESAQSDETTLTPVAAPTSFAVTEASVTSSTLTWTAVTGATSYNLYRSTTAGGEGSTPVQTGLTGTSYTNTGLTTNTTYYYKLTAVTATSESAQSSEVSLTPIAIPTGLAVTQASATSSSLTWVAVTGATTYNLYRSTTSGGEGSTPVQTGLTGTSYTNTGLTSGTTYYYKLTAVNATTESPQSSEVSLTPVAAPTGLAVAQASATSSTVTWSAVTGATSYNLYRSTTSGGEGATPIQTGLTGTSYTNTGLTNGTTYYYKLTAVNATTESAQSTEVTYVPLAVPTSLAVTQASATSASLTWAAVTGATSYNLYRSTTSGGEGATPVQTGLTGTSYANTALTSGTTYYYKLTAVNAVAETTQSSEVSLTPVAAPTSLAVTEASATSSTLTWTAVTGATSYNLYRSTTAGGEGATPIQTGLTGTSYTNTALTTGTTYYYKLTAVTATSESAQSSEVSLTPVAAPTGLAVTEASATSSTLTWTAVTGATTYNLYRSTTAGGEGSTPVQTGLTGTSYTNTGLTTNTTYYYKLTAVTGSAESAQSSEVTITPIAIPTSLAVTQASATSSTVTWTAVTGATSYNLYRSTTAGGEGSTPIQTGLTGTSYTNTGLTSGTTYYYKLTAVNATAESPQSTEVSLTPLAAPTGLAVAQASATSSTLTWTAVTGATSYNLYRSTTSGGEGATPVQTGLTGTSYTNTGLTNGTTYYYKLTAVTATSESAQSTEATYVPLAVPTSLAVTQASATNATLTWAAVTGATSYNLYRSTTSGGEGATPIQTGLTGTSYTNTGLTSGTTYYYKLTAVNAVAESGQSSEVSLTPVAAPTGLAVTEASATSASLTWTAVTGATSYNLYRSTTAGGEGATPIQTGLTGTSYTNTGLTTNTTYYYKLTTVTATSESAQSSEVSLTPIAIPTSLAVTQASATSSTVTWTAVTGATSYNLYRSTTSGGEGSTPVQTGLTGTSYTNTGLTSGTTYYYKLTAVNATAESPQSTEVSLTPVAAPTGLAVTEASATSSTLTWTAVTGATSYNLYRSTTSGGEGSTPIQTGITGTSYTNTGLTSGTTYYYTLAAVTASGTSAQSSEVSITPVATPTGLAVAQASATSSTVTWTAVTGATSYNLYRSTTAGGEGATPVQTGLTGTSYTNTGLTSGTTYYYKLTAVNAAAESPQSTEASLTPLAAPTGVAGTTSAATPGILSWSAVTGATTYTVYRGTSSGGETSLATGIAGTSYNDTTATRGTTYYYTVAAVNAGATSAQSSEVIVDPVNTSSPYYQINAGGPASSPFAADAYYSNPGGSLGSYPGNTITVTAPNAAPQAVYQTDRVGSASAMTYTLPGLTVGGSYVVRLHMAEKFYNGAGNRLFNIAINGTSVLTSFEIWAAAHAQNTAVVRNFNAIADASGNITVTFSASPNNPLIDGIEILSGSVTAAPASLVATQSLATSVALTWGTVTGATSYNLYRSTSSGTEGSTPYQTGLASASYTDSTVTAGTTYYYKVVAVNAQGESAISSEISFTPLATPTGLAVAQATATSSTVTWTAVTGATSYNLYRSTSSGGEGSTPVQTGLTGTSYTNTGLTSGTTYYYTLTAVATGKESAQSSEASLTPVAAPTGLAVAQASATSSTLTWTAVTGATSYNLYRSTTAGGEGSTPIQTGLTGTSYTNTGLTTATTYYYKLTAVTATSESVQSSEVSLTPLAIPTGLAVAQASATSSTVTWTAVTGATSYNLYRSTSSGGEGSTPVQTGLTGTSYTNTGLTSGTTYYYKLTAVAGSAESAQSTEVSLTPVAAPTGLAVTEASATSASLTWTAVTGATTYNVYRSTTAGGEGSTPYVTSLASPSYTNTGLTTGTTYYYKVTAVTATSESAQSSEVSLTPVAAPTSLAVTQATATSASLTWAAVTGATSYNLYRSTTAGGEGSTPVQTGLTGTSYTNTGLTSGTTYYYKLTAVTGSAESPQSTEVSLTPVAAPTGLAVAQASATSSTVTWTAVTGATSYNLYRSTTSGGEGATPIQTGLTGTSYTNTGLTNGTTYYYKLTAVNATSESAQSSEATYVPLAVPTSLAASQASATSATLTWAAVTGATSYNLYRSTTAGGEGATPIQTGLTGTSYTNTGLTSGTIYYYKLTAVNAVAESAQSSEVSLTPLVAPTGLAVTEASATSATLTWTAVTGATSYNLYRSTTAGGEGSTPVQTGLTGTSYTNTGLTTNTTYYYKLTAVTASSESAQSSEVSLTPIAIPTGLAVAQASATSSTLTWTAVTGATSYNLYRGTTAGGEGSTPVQTGLTGTSYTNTGLTSGTTYYYKLTAVNATAESNQSTEVSLTPLAAPTGLAVTEASATSSTLTWTAVTGATSYNLYRSTTAGGEGSTPIQTGLTGTSYTNTGLTTGTAYYYKLTAVTATSESSQSSEVTITPIVTPTGLAVTQASATSSALTWTAVTGATSYNLYRSTTAGGEGSTPVQTGLTSTSYTNTGLTSGTTYYYKLTAVNATTESPQSAEVSLTPLAAPTGLSATPSTTQVVLTWTATTGATSYTVYRGTTSGGETSLATGIATTSYTDATVTHGITYYYTVVAVNAGATSAQSSEVTIDIVNPITPYYQINAGGGAVSTFAADTYYSGSTLTGSTGNTIDVTAPNAAPQAVYQTSRSAANSSTLTYTLPSLIANGSYIVRLHMAESTWTGAGQRQFNVAINGTTVLTNFDIWAAANASDKAVVRNFNATADGSGTITIVFSFGSADRPIVNGLEILSGSVTAAPTSLAATQSLATSVSLTWGSVTGATSYNLYRSTSAGTEGSTPYKTGLASASYTDSTVTAGTTYYYKVVAVNAQGESAISSEISFTPLATPTGLAVAQATATSSTVTWTAVTGATSYNLYRSTSSGGEGSTPVQTGLTGTSYTNTGLTSGTTYYYTLTAVATGKESAQSSEASLTPVAAPTGLAVAQASATSSTLTWTAVTGATSYNLYRSTTAAGEGATPIQTGLTGTSYTNTGLTSGTTYYYKLTAVTATSESSQSSEVSLTPVAAPTGLAVTEASATSSTLTWTAVTGATSYNLYRSTTAGGEGATPIQTGLTGTSYTNTGLTTATTYYYKLTAVTATSESSQSSEVSLTPIATPTGLAVAQASATSSTLTWIAVTGATSYNLYRSTTSGGEGSTPVQTGLTGTSYTNTGLTSGTTYYYKLTAVNATAESNQSTEVSLTPLAAPTGLAVVQASATSSTVTWTAVTGATSYNLYRSTTAGGEGSAPIQTGLTGTSYTNTGLTNGTTYYYKLTAVTATSESSQSSEATYVPLAVPTSLAVTQASATSSTLTWAAVTGATSYNLYRSTTAGGEGATPIQTGLTGTSYTNTGLTSGTTYYYKLTAVNAVAESGQSSEVSLTPVATPTGLAVTEASATSASLTWAAVTGATSYNLYRSTTAGGEGSVPIQTGLTGTSYTNTGLTTNTTYYYKLTAVTATSESSQSSEVTITPIVTPTGLAVAQASATSSTLTWVAVTGATSYNLYRSTTAGGEGSVPIQTGLTGTSYTNTGLTTATTYYYKLTAVNATAESNQSTEVSLTPLAAPTGLAVTEASATSSTLTWSAVTGATSYNLYRSTTAGGEGATPIQTGLTGTSYTNTGLTTATTYYYKLTAVTGSAESSQSSEVSIKPIAIPTSLAVTQASATSTTLTWTAVTGATSYNLYRSTSSGGEGSTPVQTGLTGTSYTNTGLTSGTTYYYKLTAVNATAESLQSTEVSLAPLAAPIGLAGTPGNAQVTLAWTATTGATSYNVLRGTTSGGSYTSVGTSGSASYTDSTAVNNTTYYYVVQAVNAGATSANSTEVAVTPAVPTLLLIKRITAINGVAVSGFVSDGAGKDTNAYWPSPSSTYLRGALASTAKPGDTVEYTIYFLVVGSGNVTSVVVSNILPAHVNFAATSYNSLTPTDGGSGNSGLALALSAASYPSSPTVYLSNAADSDRGTYYASGVAVPGICTALQNINGVIVVNVVTSPTNLPAATSAASPYNSYGFVRYSVTIQ